MRLTLSRPVEIDRSEVLRYLRSGEEETLLRDINEIRGELMENIRPAAAAVRLPLEKRGESLFCGGTELSGKAISKWLESCSDCIVLGVTLGFEADRMISALGHTHPYRALIADACATAAVEDLADIASLAARDALAQGLSMTRRFSPGYGDLPLDIQPKLLSLIDARRTLGLTVSSSLMLSPVKSVTAFIGLGGGDCLKKPDSHDCGGCFMRGRCPFSKKS